MGAFPNSGIKKRVIEVLIANPYKWMSIEAIAAKLHLISNPKARGAISSSLQHMVKQGRLDVEVCKENSRSFTYRYCPTAPPEPAPPIRMDEAAALAPAPAQLPLFNTATLVAPSDMVGWINLAYDCLAEVEKCIQSCDERVKQAYDRGRRDERDRIAAALA